VGTSVRLPYLDLIPTQQGQQLDEQAVGAVVAGNLVAFDPGVSAQHRKDVQQSLLVAQLAAGVKADRYRDVTGWMRQYLSVLEQIAWVTTTAYAATRYLPQVPKFDAATLIQDTFRRKLGDCPKEVSDVLAAYKGSDGAAQVVFECPSHSGGLANYQVVHVTEDDGGDITLWMASTSLNAPQHVVRLFEADLPAGTQIQVGWVVLTLDESVFARLRSSLDGKLQGRYEPSVVPLQG